MNDAALAAPLLAPEDVRMLHPDEVRRRHALEVGALRVEQVRVYGPSLRERALQAIAQAPDPGAAQEVLFEAARAGAQARTLKILRTAVAARAALLVRGALAAGPTIKGRR